MAAAVGLALGRPMAAAEAQRVSHPGGRTVALPVLVVWLARVARAVRVAQPGPER